MPGNHEKEYEVHEERSKSDDTIIKIEEVHPDDETNKKQKIIIGAILATAIVTVIVLAILGYDPDENNDRLPIPTPITTSFHDDDKDDDEWKTVSVSSGYLALRNERAYDSSNEIGQLYSGSRVKIISEENDGYVMVYSEDLDEYGWVNAEYLQ